MGFGLATAQAERVVAGRAKYEVARECGSPRRDGGRWQRCIAHERCRIAEKLIDAAPDNSDD
jgi:hypothetical protein